MDMIFRMNTVKIHSFNNRIAEKLVCLYEKDLIEHLPLKRLLMIPDYNFTGDGTSANFDPKVFLADSVALD